MCWVEGAGELRLTAGDVVGQVEQLDSEWYLGTLRGVTGFFPISYVKVLVRSRAAWHHRYRIVFYISLHDTPYSMTRLRS